jgi:Uma2 family endonuclease
MTTAIAAATTPATPSCLPFDLTIDLVTQMTEAGLLPYDRRLFLRDGRLYEKMAKSKAHGYVGAAVTMTLVPRLPQGWGLWPESTLVLDPTNAPLPDFAVIRGYSPLDFASPQRYPSPTDVGLLIEVAVSSLQDNLTVSLEKYARAMIPCYWVIDVAGQRLLVHSDPQVTDGRGEYARVETYRPGQSVPLVLDGREVGMIPLNEFLR